MKSIASAAVIVVFGAGAANAGADYFYSAPYASVTDAGVTKTQTLSYENDIGPSHTVGGVANDLQTASVSDLAGSKSSSSVAEAPVALKDSANASAIGSAAANSDLRWHIEVNGGPALITFQALLAASGTSSNGNEYYFSTASLSVDYASPLFQVCASSVSSECGAGILSQSNFNNSIMLGSGMHTIEEKVNTSADSLATASGMADPKIFVDPTYFMNHPGVSLSIPLGLSAPEPAAWMLLLTGMGLVGGSMRRRQSAGTRGVRQGV